MADIFVYGANTEGRHGKGAALTALEQYGAVYGKVGLQGYSYGVITKELRRNYRKITLNDINREIEKLCTCARDHPEHVFRCTPFGTGLAGFTHDHMALLLVRHHPWPENIIFPDEWLALSDDYYKKSDR